MEQDRHHDYRVVGLRTNSGLVPGLILVGIGALFFLNNLHIIYIREWLAYWPVILIAVGVVKLVDSTFTGGRVAGGVLLGLGAIFLAHRDTGLEETVFPVEPPFTLEQALRPDFPPSR